MYTIVITFALQHLQKENKSICTVRCKQGRIQGVCLAVMTGPFVPQVLSIKAYKISNTVTAGL